jgi:hypothetical protein
VPGVVDVITVRPLPRKQALGGHGCERRLPGSSLPRMARLARIAPGSCRVSNSPGGPLV